MVKTALTLVVIVAVVAGAAWWWLEHTMTMSDLCGNTVVEEVVSPSGSQKAVLFERSCGATTGFSSQLSVVAANTSFRNDVGNAFVAEGYPEGYRLLWLDATTLKVIGVKGHVFKNETHVSGVNIRYE